MVSWLTAGGFIYFSAEHQIVAVNVIADANTQKGHMTSDLALSFPRRHLTARISSHSPHFSP